MSTKCLRLHLKLLHEPEIPLATMVEGMREVFETVGVRVEVGSLEPLELSELTDLAELADLEIGACTMNTVTGEQRRLFEHRGEAAAGEPVVYLLRSTLPPASGCAAHPADLPGAVVARRASPWTLAHEVGHLLGLRHVSDRNRLMTPRTSRIDDPPPVLTEEEGAIIRASPMVRDCEE
jgi:hypothetical protein